MELTFFWGRWIIKTKLKCSMQGVERVTREAVKEVEAGDGVWRRSQPKERWLEKALLMSGSGPCRYFHRKSTADAGNHPPKGSGLEHLWDVENSEELVWEQRMQREGNKRGQKGGGCGRTLFDHEQDFSSQSASLKHRSDKV